MRAKTLYARKSVLKIILVGTVLIAGLDAPFSTGPPAMRTGAPGEKTCNDVGCHNSFALNSGSGSVTIAAPGEYLPGESSDLQVTVTDPDAILFGFEVTAMNDAGQNIGSWELTDANSQFAIGNTNYVEHDNAAGDIGSHSWTARWIAPVVLTGDVTFYAAGNAANGNGNNQGDRIYTGSTTIKRGTATAIVEPEEIPVGFEVLDVFPNPFGIRTTLRYSVSRTSRIELDLFDVTGRLLQSESLGLLQPGTYDHQIASSSVPGGVLFYRLRSAERTYSGRLYHVRK